MKTEIIAKDRRGKVVFHSVEPRRMTFAQIRKECAAWCVDNEDITVKLS